MVKEIKEEQKGERLRAALTTVLRSAWTISPGRYKRVIQTPAERNGHYIIIVVASRLLHDSNHLQVYTEWHELYQMCVNHSLWGIEVESQSCEVTVED